MPNGIHKYEPLWGEWYIDELIGKGSYGEVYKIHKEENGNRIEAAAKYISIPKAEDRKNFRKYSKQEQITLFSERADKFSIEISSMLKLQNSKNVVRYEDHIKTQKDDNVGWDIIIRMELLTSLEDYLEENSFSQKDVAQLGIDICSAIESCQENDIIHRDIKIENIFIDPTKNYKLGDFGVSKVGSGTATGTVTGTEDYMAPEISVEHKYNKTVDIYALGIAMYQLLNNRRKPFIDADCVPGQDEETQAHLQRINGEKMPKPKYADEKLAKIVLKACSFDRHDRYSTANDMAKDLKAILDTLPDTEILKPRERDDYLPTDDETETDIPVSGGGTISDVGDKPDSGGTISDVGDKPPVKPKRKKIPIIIAAAVLCLLVGIGIFAYMSRTPYIPLTDITGVPEDTVQMVVGDTYELSLGYYPEEATPKHDEKVGDILFKYESSDTAIVEVSEEGIITAIAAGEATITIKCSDIVKELTVNVSDKKIDVTDIIGLSSEATLNIGSSMTVSCRVEPEDATEQAITYASSDTNIATIGPDGVITAVSAGTVTISASADGITKNMVLTVKSAETQKSLIQNNTNENNTQTNTDTNTNGNNNNTVPSNNYTPPENDTSAVDNTLSDNNTGLTDNSGGGESNKTYRIDPGSGSGIESAM